MEQKTIKRGRFTFLVSTNFDRGRNVTTARYLNGLENLFYRNTLKGKVLGKSTCNPEDEFDERFGIEMALQRAVKALYAYVSEREKRTAKKNINWMFAGTTYKNPVIRADEKT